MAENRPSGRRRFLTLGAAAFAGLAGCAGSESGGSGGEDSSDSGTDDGGSTAGSGSDSPGSGSGTGEERVSVGVLLPFTGEYDWVGGNVLPVVEMLAAEINESGGVDGHRIDVVQADTEATVDASVSAAQKLVNVDAVDFVVGRRASPSRV